MRDTRLLTNGRIYSFDSFKANPRLQSQLLIQGDRVRGEGDGAWTEGLARVDLGGATVIPGLGDSHMHFMQYCLRNIELDLGETTSLESALIMIAARAQTLPLDSWLTGGGWNKNAWSSHWPSRDDLDRVVPAIPIALISKDCHSMWCNSVALERANIDERTGDPAGGEIQRNSKGSPTGILKENATRLMWDVLPEPSPASVAQAMQVGIQQLLQWGITSVHVMEGASSLEQLQALPGRTMRFLVSIPLENLPHAIALGLRSGYGNEWLRLGPVKMFVDGALGSQTAYLHEPYQGTSSNYGMSTLRGEDLKCAVQLATEAGWAVAVHAIGDRANREVLDALEWAAPVAHRQDLRQRIEHAQLLSPADFPRFARCRVIASVQPAHVLSDWSVADQYWGERARWAYAFNSLLRHGAILAFGSDAPVESPQPWLAIAAAVSRRVSDDPERVWYPEERLALTEAIRAYTQGSAYAAGEEQWRGSLYPGQLADLVVLDRDVFALRGEELGQVQVLATMVGGAWVHVSEQIAERLQVKATGNN